MNEEFLMHHGIKGMRWGVRRFQNKDGSLTPAGKKRYDVDIAGAERNLAKAKQAEKQAKRDYNRASLSYNYNATYKAAKKYTDSLMKTDWAKQDLRSEQIKQQLNAEQKAKSNRRQKLEQGYLNKGMTKQEAEIAAYKRERTEKIIAVTAGLTVAAAATYVAYKQYDKRVDKILQAGTTLQNISKDSNRGVSDAFYASMTKMDNTKYRGVYGDTIRSLGNNVYETKIGITKNVKIASEKSAVSALSELVKGDANYAKELQVHLGLSKGQYILPQQNKVIEKGLASLKAGKVDAKVYDALNLTLCNHNLPTSESINKGFYSKLISNGYDAIMDVNDMKYSGFKSKKPVIVFNGSAKTAIQNVRELGKEEISKDKMKAFMEISVRELTPAAVGIAASRGAVKASKKASDARLNDRIVAEYRKQHPNTDLSYTEIVRNYRNSH